MKLVIDPNVLKKYNLSVEEFMLLYLGSKLVSIKDVQQSLIDKKLAAKNEITGGIVTDSNTKNLIDTIIIESDKSVVDKDKEYQELAKELQELYPSGRKSGTTYLWRGTSAEVAKKLKTLVVKYNYTFTREQVIKATKEYIESFNGNYTKMRLLKYFILKTEKDVDGNVNVISELMTLIENEGQLESQREDWMSSIV